MVTVPDEKPTGVVTVGLAPALTVVPVVTSPDLPTPLYVTT